MRQHRPPVRQLPAEAQRRVAARRKAGVYQRRGRLIPEPCEDCGAEKVERHHEDYSRPLDVVWLCRPCHMARHRSITNAASSAAGSLR